MALVTGLSGTNSATEALVTDGFTRYSGLALDAFHDAESLVNTLATVTAPVTAFNIDFPVPPDLGAPFSKPVVPVAPDLQFNDPGVPGSLSISTPGVTGVSVPTFINNPPVFNSPQVPAALSGNDPGAAPGIDDVSVPDAPQFTIPDVPDLLGLVIPQVPAIQYFQFTDTLADFNGDAPQVSPFTDRAYTSVNTAAITATIQAMLNGSTGLPPEIEQALFDRARARLGITAAKAVQEAMEDWSSRGFSLPGGEVAKRVEAARQGNQDAENALNRDITIQVHNVIVDQIKIAVAQGIAYERELMLLYNTVQDRAFQVVKYTTDAAIAVFNAQVQNYNVKVEAFKARAQVFLQRVQAEQTKVELYKAEIDGQRLIGDINVQTVQIYRERVSALTAFAELYRVQVEGVRAKVDVERLRVDAYRAVVEAFAQRVIAKRAEFEGYKYQVEAESTKVEAYKAEVSAYAELVRAANVQLETQLAGPRFQLQSDALRIQKYQADTTQYVARVDAEAKRITAGVQIFDGLERQYASELGAEQARVVADSRQFELAVELGKAQTSVALDTAKLYVSQIEENAKIIVEALKGAAATTAQLAAGAMSAVNLSARLGVENNSSLSESVNHNLDGISPVSA